MSAPSPARIQYMLDKLAQLRLSGPLGGSQLTTMARRLAALLGTGNASRNTVKALQASGSSSALHAASEVSAPAREAIGDVFATSRNQPQRLGLRSDTGMWERQLDGDVLHRNMPSRLHTGLPKPAVPPTVPPGVPDDFAQRGWYPYPGAKHATLASPLGQSQFMANLVKALRGAGSAAAGGAKKYWGNLSGKTYAAAKSQASSASNRADMLGRKVDYAEHRLYSDNEAWNDARERVRGAISGLREGRERYPISHGFRPLQRLKEDHVRDAFQEYKARGRETYVGARGRAHLNEALAEHGPAVEASRQATTAADDAFDARGLTRGLTGAAGLGGLYAGGAFDQSKRGYFTPTPAALDSFVYACLAEGVTDVNAIVALVKQACLDTVSQSPAFAEGVRIGMAKQAGILDTIKDKAHGAAEGWRNAPGHYTTIQQDAASMAGARGAVGGLLPGAAGGLLLRRMGGRSLADLATLKGPKAGIPGYVASALLGSVIGGTAGSMTGSGMTRALQNKEAPTIVDRLRAAFAGAKSAAVNPWTAAKVIGGVGALGAGAVALNDNDTGLFAPARRFYGGLWDKMRGKAQLRPGAVSPQAQARAAFIGQNQGRWAEQGQRAWEAQQERNQLIAAGGDTTFADKAHPAPFRSAPTTMSGVNPTNPWVVNPQSRSLSMFQ